MARDMTREQVIALMRLGLERTGGSYTQLARLLTMGEAGDRRLIAFLKRFRCYLMDGELRATA